jgi:hypothetical protein
VLTHVIATVRQVALRRIGKLVGRFELFFVSVAVGTKRFLMTGGTALTRISGVKTMLFEEVSSLVIE